MDREVEAEFQAVEEQGVRANPYRAGRSMAIGRRGMVASHNIFATQAGLDTLKSGGSAMDAAVTAAAVMAVTEPMWTGLGGDAFFLYFDAKTGKIHGLNGSGRSPSGLSRKYFEEKGQDGINLTSWEAVTVPGGVDAWAEGIKRFGKKSLADALAPAIDFAENGFPVTERTARAWNAFSRFLKADQSANRIYLINGKPPVTGQVFKNPEISASLKQVAQGGRDAFYLGPIAEEIVRYSKETGGFLSMDDFTRHSSTWVEPISTAYHGHEVFQIPPNGQGICVLLMLNMLEGVDFDHVKYYSTDYFHLLIETAKLAYQDLYRYTADPEEVRIPIQDLLSKEYAAERRKLIDPNKAASMAKPGLPPGGDTVYLTAMDNEGNAVSFINSIYYPFGSRIVAGKTGIILQNRGFGFTLEPGHLNEYAPRKRPFHTIIPGMVKKDGRLYLSYGLAGGPIQPQVQVQILLSHLNYGLTIQEAIDIPRCNHLGGADLQCEPGIERDTMIQLESMGHKVVSRTAGVWGIFGYAHAIMVDPVTGTYFGASDPRSDSAALGF